MRICLIAFVSLIIQNSIYLFIINSCEIDGLNRSWIDYLNEGY